MTGRRLDGEAGGLEPADELADVFPHLPVLYLPTRRGRRSRRRQPSRAGHEAQLVDSRSWNGRLRGGYVWISTFSGLPGSIPSSPRTGISVWQKASNFSSDSQTSKT